VLGGRNSHTGDSWVLGYRFGALPVGVLTCWFSGLVASPLDPLVVPLPLCPIFQLYLLSRSRTRHRYHQHRRRSLPPTRLLLYLPTVTPLFGKISRERVDTLELLYRANQVHEDKEQDRGNRSVASALKNVQKPSGNAARTKASRHKTSWHATARTARERSAPNNVDRLVRISYRNVLAVVCHALNWT
jgi:hypothetical protein